MSYWQELPVTVSCPTWTSGDFRQVPILVKIVALLALSLVTILVIAYGAAMFLVNV